MRLHSLRLENFRGVVEREVEFPDRGVVIVQGPNEVGKTSMMQGLDLLLNEKDSTRKQSVRDVQPVGRDVPVVVSAVISAGPYRFEYSKQWLKGSTTQLRVTQPRAETVTGAEAHDRVLEILGETVDMELFNALRVMQGEPAGNQVKLHGNAALRAALEAASGTAISGDAGVENLVEAIEAEYLKFFTRGGRPTGEYRDSEQVLESAVAEVEVARLKLAEIDEQVEKFARLESEAERLRDERGEAQKNLEKHDAKNRELEGHREHLKAAQTAFEVAKQAHEAAVRALDERQKLVEDSEQRERDARKAEDAHRVAAQQVEAKQKDLQRFEVELEEADAAFAAMRKRVGALEKSLAAAGKREEFERESKRLKEVERVRKQLDAANEVLAGNVVDDKKLDAIRKAAGELDVARAVLSDASAQVEISVIEPESVSIDGETVDVAPESGLQLAVTRVLNLGIGTNVSLAIKPESGADERRRNADSAQEKFDALLAGAEAASLDAATEANTVYRQNSAKKHSAASELAALLAGGSEEDLRARVAALSNVVGAEEVAHEVGGASREVGGVAHEVGGAAQEVAESAREELSSLEGELVEAQTDRGVAEDAAKLARDARDEAAKSLSDANVVATKSQSDSQHTNTELRRSKQLLQDAEHQVSGEALADRVEVAAKVLDQAEKTLEMAKDELSAHDPDTVAELLKNAQKRVERNVTELREVEKDLDRVRGALETMGAEGRQEDLDAALSDEEAAQQKRDRLARQANAAQLLHETVQRYQKETWQRYVAPFEERITTLGRLVFGSDVSFEVSAELEIVNRTRGGDTVAFGDLSTGAQEQVSLLSRLACAQLVADGGGVPVLIDDALGNSDPKRLEGLGAVLNRAGRDAQVIVLTCTPERYRDVGDATVIRL